ncbi:hypothetical protein Tco_0296256 [Tanacetum coccineum]
MIDRDKIMVVAGGNIMRKTPQEAYDLIENMTQHHYQWDSEVYYDTTTNMSAYYSKTTFRPIIVNKLRVPWHKMYTGYNYSKVFNIKQEPFPLRLPILLSRLFPHLLPLRNSDFLLEETDAFLAFDSTPLPPQELNNDYERDILFLEKLLKDEPSEAKNSEIDSLNKGLSDTFLMEDMEIKFNPLKDIDDPVPIPRVSKKPLNSLDPILETFDMTITNPLFDFDFEFTLNSDYPIFDIQNEESDESETETIMEEVQIHSSQSTAQILPSYKGLKTKQKRFDSGYGCFGNIHVSCHVDATWLPYGDTYLPRGDTYLPRGDTWLPRGRHCEMAVAAFQWQPAMWRRCRHGRYEVFSTWMAFGGNTRDLGSFGEETDEITDLHQNLKEVFLTEREDGVAGIKRRRRDPSSDGVRTYGYSSVGRFDVFFHDQLLVFQQHQDESLYDSWTRFKDLSLHIINLIVEGDLRKFSDIGAWFAIGDCAQYDKKCSNPTSAISDETIANPNVQIVWDDMVRVQVPRCMAWLDYDENVYSLSTMDNEVGVTSFKSITQTLPLFEEYTPPETYPEEVEKTLGTPIVVEPLNQTKLEEVGLHCNHDTPFSSREVPSFDRPEPQPLLNNPYLDVSLGDVIGPEPTIKPHSIDDPKRHYGFKPGLLGKSVSLGVDISDWEMFDDDSGLESKEVSPIGEELSLFDRPNKVERGRKAHLLEDKQIPSVGYLMRYGYSSVGRFDLFFRDQLLVFQQHSDESLYDSWTRFNDVIQKVPNHGLSIWTLIEIFLKHLDSLSRHIINLTADGDLRKFSDIGAWYAIEDCAQYDKKYSNPTSVISDETIANPNAQIVGDDMVRVQVPRCMAWLDYDEHVDSLSTMEIMREVPNFDGPEPQPSLNSPSLDVSLGDVIGPEPPIKPHSPDSSRMKVVDYLTTQTPHLPHVTNSHPKGVYSYCNPGIDDPKRHYGFKPRLLGKSVSLGVDISNWEMFDDDWGLESKEVSPLGEELSLVDRPNEVESFGTIGIHGRKAHLLEDKQFPSVGVFDEVFSTWMAFGGNTRDLGSLGEETDEITDLHQIHEEVLLTEREDSVAGIKRRCRDPSSDDVRDLVTALGRSRLNEDLESST